MLVRIVDSAKVDDSTQLHAAIIEAGSAIGLDVTGLVVQRERNFDKSPEEPCMASLSCTVETLNSKGLYIDNSTSQSSEVEQDDFKSYDIQKPKNFCFINLLLEFIYPCLTRSN